MSPLLTILICCHNGEEYLGECFSSILGQGAAEDALRVIIVDDGSKDNSWRLIEDFAGKHPYVLTLRHLKNCGLPAACNMGLSRIETPYFTRLDADDYILSDFLETVIETIKLVKADFYLFDRYELCGKERRLVSDLKDDIYKWIASGTVFKTDIVKKLAGYSDEYWEEYDLYLRLLENGYKFHYIARPLYVYRRHSRSMTANIDQRESGLETLKKKWGENVLQKYGNYKRHLLVGAAV